MSAIPAGVGNTVMSIIRIRNLVTAAPVLFVTDRLIDIVPKVELLPGFEVRSRTRFGGKEAGAPGSRTLTKNPVLRSSGDARFSGPGAPNFWVTPAMNVPWVSPNWKSALLLLLSTGVELGQVPKFPIAPPLPHWSRWKLCSVVLPLTGGRFLSSRRISQTPPPVFAPKQTATSLST